MRMLLILGMMAVQLGTNGQETRPIVDPKSNQIPLDPNLLQFRRKFVQGERDVYRLTLKILLEKSGTVIGTGEQTQFFRKVDRAESEVALLTTLRLASENDQELWSERDRTSKGKYNAFGIIISPEKVSGNQIALGNILQYGMLIPYRGLKPSGPQSFDYRFAENTEHFIRGTFELESKTLDRAIIRTKVKFYNRETPVPVDVEARTTWNLSTGRAELISMVTKNLPQDKGSAKVQSMSIEAVRLSPTKTDKS